MRKGTCKHFNGTVGGQNACCSAGVNYRELVGGPDFGWLVRLPCHAWNQSAVVCDQREEPTPEEIAESEGEIRAATERFVRTLPLILDMKKRHKGKDAREVVECPVCKGKLHMSISSYNGHVSGACETEGCLSWME